MPSRISARRKRAGAPSAALACALIAALAGCGDGSDSETTSTPVTPTQPTTVAAPEGPAVKVCDRRLARELTPVLRSSGFHGEALRPAPSGTPRHSTCELGPVELTVDNAPDAYQRYLNRIVETAQFSDSKYSRVPRTVR